MLFRCPTVESTSPFILIPWSLTVNHCLLKHSYWRTPWLVGTWASKITSVCLSLVRQPSIFNHTHTRALTHMQRTDIKTLAVTWEVYLVCFQLLGFGHRAAVIQRNCEPKSQMLVNSACESELWAHSPGILRETSLRESLQSRARISPAAVETAECGSSQTASDPPRYTVNTIIKYIYMLLF